MNELPKDPYVCPFCGYEPPSRTLQGRRSHLGSCETYDRALEELAADRGVSVQRVKETHENTDAIATSWYDLKSKRQSETVSGLATRLRERLGSYGEVPDSLHESGTERDGFLSYAAEFHAMLFGIAAGVMVAHNPEYFDLLVGLLATAFGVERVGRVIPQIKERYLSQIRDEVHYFMGGAIVGHVYVQWLNGEALLPDVSQVVNATATLV